MKKFLTILLSVLTICLSCNLLACDSSGSEGGNGGNETPRQEEPETPNEPQQPISEYSKLSMEEKRFFSTFTISFMPKLNDPSSVSIANISYSSYNQSIYLISIRAKNAYGGVALQEYFYFAKNWTVPGKEEKYDKYATSVLAGTIIVSTRVTKEENLTAAAIVAIINPEENIDDITYSVSQLNKALEEYKKEEGYI